MAASNFSMSLRQLAFGVQVAVTADALGAVVPQIRLAFFQSAFSRTPLWFYLALFGVLVAGQTLYVFKW